MRLVKCLLRAELARISLFITVCNVALVLNFKCGECLKESNLYETEHKYITSVMYCTLAYSLLFLVHHRSAEM